MRGSDAARRLAAMQSMIAAYPNRQKQERVEARNPLQMIMDAVWQQPAPAQVRVPLSIVAVFSVVAHVAHCVRAWLAVLALALGMACMTAR